MEDLGSALSAAMDIMKIEFTLGGYTFSWWDVFIWSLIAVVVGTLVVKFLSN